MKTSVAHGLLVVGCLLLFVSAALGLVGPFTNGNFNGNLSGWNTAGYAVAVGAQGSVTPIGGSFQALIASGSGGCPSAGDPPHPAGKVRDGRGMMHVMGGHSLFSKPGTSMAAPHYTCGSTTVADVTEAALETDLSLPSGAINAALPNNFTTPGCDASVCTATDGGAIWQTFSVTAPTTLSFHWNFATNEVVPTQWDAALYTWQVGGNPAQVFELADTTQSSILNQSTGSSPTFTTMTGYGVVNIPITVSGTYTIGFISMQTGDDSVSSGTYISNVQVGSGAVTPGTPIPPTWSLALAGLALLALYCGWRKLTGTRAA